ESCVVWERRREVARCSVVDRKGGKIRCERVRSSVVHFIGYIVAEIAPSKLDALSLQPKGHRARHDYLDSHVLERSGSRVNIFGEELTGKVGRLGALAGRIYHDIVSGNLGKQDHRLNQIAV